MLFHRLAHALPSRRARVAVGAVAYLAFAAAVIASTLHRGEEDARAQQAEVAQFYGNLASRNFDFETAERYFRESIEYIRACGGEDGSWYAEAHEDLAEALEAQGRVRDAEATYRRALALYERAYGRESENLIGPLSALADIYATAGRDSAANSCTSRIREIRAGGVAAAEGEFANFRKRYRAALAARRPVNNLELANRLMSLGQLHLGRGKADRAENEFAEAFEIRRAAFGSRDHRTVEARAALGRARLALGKFTKARADLESVLASNERAFGRDATGLSQELTLLGNIEMRCADYAAADECYLRVFESVERRVGREHWYLVPVLEKLASVRAEMGQFSVARGLRKRIMRIHVQALGAESYAVGVDLLKLAEIEERAGVSGWARANCSAAVRTLTAAVGPRHPTTVEARLYLRELWMHVTPRPVPVVPRNVVGGEKGAPGGEEEELEDPLA